jgi:hypothetical protein
MNVSRVILSLLKFKKLLNFFGIRSFKKISAKEEVALKGLKSLQVGDLSKLILTEGQIFAFLKFFETIFKCKLRFAAFKKAIFPGKLL